MLSNKVKLVETASIHFDREARQRSQIDVSDIIESVRKNGVLTPICITRSGRLIFGERRLTAARQCGLKEILARIADDNLAPLDYEALELEENVMRKDLPWQDQVRALSRMYEIYTTRHPNSGLENFARSMGYSITWVRQGIGAATEIASGNERVASAPGLKAATNIVIRQKARENDNTLADILDTIAVPDGPTAAPPIMGESLLNTDFLLWAPEYSGPKFNLLHCDFPYGIDLQSSDQLGAGSRHASYADSPDTYWTLLRTLAEHEDRLLSASAHMIFWYSMKYHTETLDFFRTKMPSWTFDELPLVWLKSDNKGIAPDVERRPRRIYETALFGWRGDRKLVKLAANAYAAPKDATSAHPSSKPEPMLRHFFQMVVDHHTRMLDPTCGAGSSIRAAESLGASSVLGLEIDLEFFELAQTKLRNFRAMSKLTEGADV